MDDIVIVCSPTNHGLWNTIQANCRICNETIYLSDSSIESVKQQQPEVDLEKNPPILVCLSCGIHQLEKEDVTIMPLTEGQIKELSNAIRDRGNQSL